jgi:hypothetical protein
MGSAKCKGLVTKTHELMVLTSHITMGTNPIPKSS